MYRHQFCDSNYLRTQSYGTKRDFQISTAAMLKCPATGSSSDLYMMASTFDIVGGLVSKKNLVSDFYGGRVHSNPLLPMD